MFSITNLCFSSCYDAYNNYYCYSAWYYYGRWILLGVCILCIFLSVFLMAYVFPALRASPNLVSPLT